MSIIVYIKVMYEIFKTENYLKWFKKLRDKTAKYVITLRIERLKNGNFGDSKNVGEKVFELRIDIGKGYRVYFTNKEKEVILLLIGGICIAITIFRDLGSWDNTVMIILTVIWVIIAVVADVFSRSFGVNKLDGNAMFWILNVAKDLLIIGGLLSIR